MGPVEAAWRSVLPRFAVPLEQFKEMVRDWEIHPVYLDGECIGAVLVDGPEIHACIASGYGRWFGKAHLRILNAVIAKHGYAQTSATTDAGKAFVARLGFEKYGDSYRREKLWALNQS